MKIFPIILSILLASCQTLMVPGEKALKVKNIYAEYFSLAEEYYSLKKYEKAAGLFEKAAVEKSQRVKALYKAARCYAFLQKWQESLDIYERLLRLDKSNTILKENIAYIAFKRGDAKKSRKLYEALIDEVPDSKVIVQNYIKVLMEMQEFDAAKKYVDEYKTQRFDEDEEIVKIEAALLEALGGKEKSDGKEGAEGESTDASESGAEKSET